MTEDEAKSKTCPFTFAVPEVRGIDACTRESGPWNCIGSNCMAWQFEPAEYEDGEPLPFGNIPADPGWEKNGEVWCAGGQYGSGQKRQRWRRALPRTGFCNLIEGTR